MSSELLLRDRGGFGRGYTPICEIGEATADTGIAFGILRLVAGERHRPPEGRESAYLLLDGEVRLGFGGERARAGRRSLFDEEPVAIHGPAGAELEVEAISDAELALFQVENERQFGCELFDRRNMLDCEHRGKGLLGDTSYRIVRTLFDARNRPEANLVLGEVVNFPGRWSSYPPHHHPQPEIYHYRFTEPQGYGHGELGDEVLKIRHRDTVKILEQRDHSQVAAPGYGMYYIWAIRHLPDDPYTVPEFTEEHAWLLEADAPVWTGGEGEGRR